MTRRRRPTPFAGFKLSRLEDRVTPAIVADVPTWRQSADGVVGTVSDVAPDPTDPNILYVSGASGGLFRTRNAQSGSPLWDAFGRDDAALSKANATAVGIADTLPSLSVADMSLNPDDPNQLLFGIGDMQNGGRLTGDLVGAYFTTAARDDKPAFVRLSGPTEVVPDSTGNVLDGDPNTLGVQPIPRYPQGAFVNNLVRSVAVRSLPVLPGNPFGLRTTAEANVAAAAAAAATAVGRDPAQAVATALPADGRIVGYLLVGGDAGVYLAYRRANGSIDPFVRISGRGGVAVDSTTGLSSGVNTLGPANPARPVTQSVGDLTTPDVGASSDIVPDPSNPRRVYVASSLGLYRTDDLTVFAPPAAGATVAAAYPSFADLTPALTYATGQSAGTLIKAIGSVAGAADQQSHVRMRVAVHASQQNGLDVNVLYVTVANPGVERTVYPPDTNSGAPTGPTDSQLTVLYATDQLQKTAYTVAGTKVVNDKTVPAVVPLVSYPTTPAGDYFYYDPATDRLTTALNPTTGAPAGTKVQTTGVSYRTDRDGQYVIIGPAGTPVTDGSGFVRDASGAVTLDINGDKVLKVGYNKQVVAGYGFLRDNDSTALLSDSTGATTKLIAVGNGFGTGTFSQMDEPLQLGPTIGTITDATYANPVVLTIDAPGGDHRLNTGDRVLIEQQGGNAAPNSVWTVTRTSKTQVSLVNSAGTGKFNLSSATIRQVFGVANASGTGFAGRADSDIRLAVAADPTNPNLVYIGGGQIGQYGQFVGDAYPTFSGSNVVRGDRSRPRLNGFLSTELVSNDVSYQWTALNGYKAATATAPGSVSNPRPTDAAASYVNLVFGPSVNGQAKLYAATDNGVFVRTNPQSNGRISRNSPASSDANVWSNLNGTGRSALQLGVSDGYFISNSSFTDANGVTTTQSAIDFPTIRTLFDPVTRTSVSATDVDGVTTPGQSYRFFNSGGLFTDVSGAVFFGAGTSYEVYNSAGTLISSASMTLATPTATAPNIFDSALIAGDKTANSRPYLLVRANQTKPSNPGSVSSGAGRVIIGGLALYEDDEPNYFPGEPSDGSGSGIGNIVGNITPAGLTAGSRFSALRYGGRQPGAVITVDGQRQIQYVETPGSSTPAPTAASCSSARRPAGSASPPCRAPGCRPATPPLTTLW